MWYLDLCFSWGVCTACADGSCAGSCCYLAQCCRGGGFYPNSAVFELVLGLSVLFKEFLRLRLYSLAALAVYFFALCASPPLRPLPAVAGLVGFCYGPPHWLSLRVCVGPFWGGGAVSSFSPPAQRGGLRKLFWLQVPVLLLRQSYVCWVCGVFGAALGFPPCAVLFLWGLRFCAASPAAGCSSGFLPFLTLSA